MPALATSALRRVGVRRQALAPRSYAGAGTTAAILGGAGLVIGLLALPTFVIGPWMVKAFKPEWSYGRRLGASFAVSFIAGTLVSVARGLGGGSSSAGKEGADA
jgi:hypothetical protein